MIKRLVPLSPRRASIVLVAITAWAHAAPAQVPPAPPVAGPNAQAALASGEHFPFEIGHAARADSAYTISATQPASSKLTGQKIRLVIVDGSPTGTTTRLFTFACGKHKTVAQLDALLADIFRCFLATPPPAPNQELGKIGDVRYGGEVHFVAESAQDLRFDTLTANEPVRASHYSRADIEALQAALTGVPPA